ncbi:MAG TPA: hypothetical protein VIU16_11980 [Gaiellaceae bacterium]
MTQATTSELAVRSFDGIEVALLWSRLTDRLSVVVSDIRNGESFSFLPPREKALDAFYHPFAYAPRDAALDALAARGPVYA